VFTLRAHASMPEVRLESQWYTADAHAERPPPPPQLDTLPAGVWELPATPSALREEIARLQNSVVRAVTCPARVVRSSCRSAPRASAQVHLERSNAELSAEDPEDPDFKEAIEENEVVLVAQRYKIEQCQLRLQQLGGDRVAHDDSLDMRVEAAAPPPAVADTSGGDGAAAPAVVVNAASLPQEGGAPIALTDLQLHQAPLMTAAPAGEALDLATVIAAASTPGATAGVAGSDTAPPVVQAAQMEPEPEPAEGVDDGLYL
jgi:hypothetical protein